MKHVTRYIIFNILLISQVYAAQPEWIKETERQVKGGDIIHWGMSEAPTPELATFKARQAAIATIMDECGGIANKAIIPRKQHVELKGSKGTEGQAQVFVAYAHVSIDFTSCDQAKLSKVKKEDVENKDMAKDQRKYRSMIGVTSEAEGFWEENREMLQKEAEEASKEKEATVEEITAEIDALAKDWMKGSSRIEVCVAVMEETEKAYARKERLGDSDASIAVAKRKFLKTQSICRNTKITKVMPEQDDELNTLKERKCRMELNYLGDSLKKQMTQFNWEKDPQTVTLNRDVRNKLQECLVIGATEDMRKHE